MNKLWRIKDANPSIQDNLSHSLNISKVTAQLLANRGVENPKDAQEFLSLSLAAFHDPFLLKGMDKAVLRIKDAIKKGERILVYGDYDVDGMTSVTVL